jgi:HEAT repeat protein
MNKTTQSLLAAIADDDDTAAEHAALAFKNLGDSALPGLRDLLDSADDDERWWAVCALAAIGTPDAVTMLTSALEDPNPDVRACAVVALAGLKPPQAVEPLVARLADPSSYVARLAADGLAQFGAVAAPALIGALEEGEAVTRIGAARALNVIQPKEAIPALIAALDDPSAAVTSYAEDALEQMGVGMVYFKP